MTQERDDFEHRLGQGLKRWAEAGQPTMDLEAYVQGRAGAPAREPRRAWKGWLGGVAAAAGLILVLFATFPTWAGAASGFPIVGPVVREIILKDAGLAWAYEVGVLQGTMAEANDGAVTARVLGVMADQFRTTVIYQIAGVEKPAESDGKPTQWEGTLLSRFAEPVYTWPIVKVKQLPGQTQIVVSQDQPKWTPVGLVGIFSTSPLGVEVGTAEITIAYQGHTVPLSFPVSRAEAAKYSREIPVGQSRTVDDVTVTLHSVVQTPVETVMQYSIQRPEYRGSWGWSNHSFSARVETAGEPVYGGYQYNEGTSTYQTFPIVQGAARLVFPALVKRTEGQITWQLKPGNIQRFEETEITLTDWSQQANRLYVNWVYQPQGRFVAFDGFEVLDANGTAYPVTFRQGSESVSDDRPRDKADDFELPEGVTPVAIRATQIGVRATGPWVFDLPPR